MGDAGFRVHPETISRYASTVGEHGGQLAQIQSAVSGITVSGDAFGRLPNAGHLSQIYQEHAEANRQNLSALVEVLNHAVQGLAQTAQNYAQHDQEISASIGGGQ